MLAELSTVFTQVIKWIGEFITALTTTETGALNAILPLFLLGLGVTLISVCARMLRSIMWGN